MRAPSSSDPATDRAETDRAGHTVAGGQFLGFLLAGEEYMVEILEVQEIVAALPITPVPGSSSYLRGVVNLRGRVIPILDLRARFGMPEAQDLPEACIIVVRPGETEVGMLVDGVSEVLEVGEGELAPATSFGGHIPADYLLGIARSGDGVRFLLDVNRVVAVPDVTEAAGFPE